MNTSYYWYGEDRVWFEVLFRLKLRVNINEGFRIWKILIMMGNENRKYQNRLTANVLKKTITSFLLSRDANGVIGYEVMYGSSRRVADMVFISHGHSYAIEIKSEYDTTSRLGGQLEDYLTLFDYILIFSAPNHIDTIYSTLPNQIGLYQISKIGIQKVRRELLNHQVLKKEMLCSIPSAKLKTDFSVKGKLSSDEIRAIVEKKSFKIIHEYFINYCITRLLSGKSSITEDVFSKQKEKNPCDYIII